MQQSRQFPLYVQFMELNPADVGSLILPLILRHQRQQANRGFVPSNLAIAFAREYYADYERAHEMQRTEIGPSDVFMEGMAFLERAGLLIPLAFEGVGHGSWMKLSRAGIAAAENGVATTAISSLECGRLLHPSIARECLREVERGPDGYDSAIFKAFREVELRLRAVTKSEGTKDAIRVVNEAFAPPNGIFVDLNGDQNEWRGIRDCFAGAIAAFRNPVAHRVVGHNDAEQVMRLLIYASSLLYLTEGICEAR